MNVANIICKQGRIAYDHLDLQSRYPMQCANCCLYFSKNKLVELIEILVELY